MFSERQPTRGDGAGGGGRPLGDGNSNLNTVCKSYFQADVQSITKRSSVLALEDDLLATGLGRWLF